MRAESDNVSAAAEEQTSSLTQGAQSAQTLTEQADSLRNRLDMFRVGIEQTADGRHPATGSRQQGAAADGGKPTTE